MDIVIRGKNVEVSDALRSSALKQMAKLDRFANGSFGRAEVDFSEERNPRIGDNQVCEVLVHVKGHLLKAHAAASEPFAAVSMAVDKIEHQVKKLKGKRVARTHTKKGRVESPVATGDVTEEKEPVRIVKMQPATVKPMSAEEAALQLELLGHNFFFFTSSESGRAAVIYRRSDGDLGLIEATG